MPLGLKKWEGGRKKERKKYTAGDGNGEEEEQQAEGGRLGQCSHGQSIGGIKSSSLLLQSRQPARSYGWELGAGSREQEAGRLDGDAHAWPLACCVVFPHSYRTVPYSIPSVNHRNASRLSQHRPLRYSFASTSALE